MKITPNDALGYGSMPLRVYYGASAAATNTVQCGEGMCSGNGDADCDISSLTIPAGRLYLFLGLQTDTWVLSTGYAFSVSTQSSALLLSSSSPVDNDGYPTYATICESTATLFDKTLGGTCIINGFIGKFRNQAINPSCAAGNQDATIWPYQGAMGANRSPFFPCGGGDDHNMPEKAFDWFRWGYICPVRPTKLWSYCGSYGEYNNGGSIELRGFANSAFTNGNLLYKGPIPDGNSNDVRKYLDFNQPLNNTVGWYFFEIKNTSPPLGGGILCSSMSFRLAV
jgi:hypothetical protein